MVFNYSDVFQSKWLYNDIIELALLH